MTKRELEQIGIAMGREFYNQCMTNGVPEGEMITSDKACELAGKSKGWLYNHARELPHANGLYSRTASLAYLNR